MQIKLINNNNKCHFSVYKTNLSLQAKLSPVSKEIVVKVECDDSGINYGIYDEIQQEMRRAKVSQALFAKVSAAKSQVHVCACVLNESNILINRRQDSTFIHFDRCFYPKRLALHSR